MLKLDKFKKVAQDDSTVTMRHDDGHEMKILLKGISSKIQREQLKRMKLAEGGKVDSGKQRFDNERGVHPDPNEDGKSGMSMAGVYARHAKDKGEVGKKSKELAVSEHQKTLSELKDLKNKDRKYLAEGGDPASEEAAPVDSQPKQDPSHVTNVIVNPSPNQAAPVQQQVQQPKQVIPQEAEGVPSSPAADYGQEPVNVQQPDINSSTIKNTDPYGTMNPAAVSLNAQKSVANQRDINISKGNAEAEVQQGYNDARAQLAQRDQDNFNNYILKPTEDFKRYMNDHPINPNEYLESRGTGHKIANAVGLFLGGFKQGIVGGSNPALDVINSQIDRDISAQKARADQQHTIWGAYKELYGDSNVTNNLAKASMIDLYNNKMKQVALRLNTPQAWANYQLASGQMAIDKSKALGEAAIDLKNLPGFKGNVAPGGTNLDKQPNKFAPNNVKLKPADALLSPNAEELYQSLAYRKDAMAAKDWPIVQDQYYKARQAESVMANVDNVINTMYKAARAGGRSDYTRRNLSHSGAAALGGVGLGAVGAGLGAMVGSPGIGATAGSTVGAGLGSAKDVVLGPVSANNKTYFLNQSRLRGDLRSVLPNVGQDEIDHILDANSPEYNDSPALAHKKAEAVKQFIRTNVQKGALENYNMWNNK